MSGSEDKGAGQTRLAVTPDEALRRALLHAVRTSAESVPLASCLYRRCAEDVYAPHPLPHFTRSGVDGYAVRAADIAGASSDHPLMLKVVEHIPCGHVPDCRVEAGQASRIMTGAMLPEGADTVVMLEMVQVIEGEEGERIQIVRSLPHGRNVTTAGFEAMQGERMIERGTMLLEGHIALLATFGYEQITVHRQPRVAIIPTGSELLPVSSPLTMGRIRNSNGYMLAAQTAKAGAMPLLGPPASDDVKELELRLEEAVDSADMVITTGGVSVGDYDRMADWLLGSERQLLFNKIQMRPGSVTSAGVYRGKLIFALSGNPGACSVGFELFVRPVLCAMQGTAAASYRIVQAVIAHDYDKSNAYTRYLRSTLGAEQGRLVVQITGSDQSSVMRTIAESNSLMVIPPGGGVRAGELVQVIVLD